jgi:hypothetical protein
VFSALYTDLFFDSKQHLWFALSLGSFSPVVVSGFAASAQEPDAEVMLDDIKNVAAQLEKFKDALAVFPNDGVKTSHVNVLVTFPQVVYLIGFFAGSLSRYDDDQAFFEKRC